jgi:hypothetical protein
MVSQPKRPGNEVIFELVSVIGSFPPLVWVKTHRCKAAPFMNVATMTQKNVTGKIQNLGTDVSKHRFPKLSF